ncbi:MAG: hypothetical protein P4L66_12550 [Acetobacteraceae bacterium]|nr:hypothetical protein [Acetobacteraceae bacterium]
MSLTLGRNSRASGVDTLADVSIANVNVAKHLLELAIKITNEEVRKELLVNAEKLLDNSDAITSTIKRFKILPR